MSTIAWRGGSGAWASRTSWQSLNVPGSTDSVLFAANVAGTASLLGPAAIANATLAASTQVTLAVESTLELSGVLSLAGGTLDLQTFGVIEGGTLDFHGGTFRADGGILDDVVWLGGTLGGGATVTAATILASQAAAHGDLAVAGSLVLADGSYRAATLTLNGFGAPASPELDVAASSIAIMGPDSRIVLSQDGPATSTDTPPSGPAPILGGPGTWDNQGLLVSGALSATITAADYLNEGTIVLNAATVADVTEYFPNVGPLTWTGHFSPSLTLAGANFDNLGAIIGHGATLSLTDGNFRNEGVVTLLADSGEAVVALPTAHVGTASFLSTFDVAASVQSFINVGTIIAGTIDFRDTVTLSQLGILEGVVVFSGTLDLGGGTLDAATLRAGTQYVIQGVVRDGTIIGGAGLDITHATLLGVTVQDNRLVTLTDVSGPANVTLNATTVELAYTSPRSLEHVTIVAGTPLVTDKLAIEGGSLTLSATTTIVDATIGGTLDISGGSLIADGLIRIDGGSAHISFLSGGGTITLSHHASVTIDSLAADAHLLIDFSDNSNALVLPGNLTGVGRLGLTVAGLQAGDLIDFMAVSNAGGTVFAQPGAAISGGRLNVQGASGDKASLATRQKGLSFVTSADDSGGVIVSVACFSHGTSIATPSGERLVETLAIGDLVRTASGATRPIHWLGRRAYTRSLVARQPQLRPVCVAPGALAPNVPRRPLLLSPLHGLFIEGALVPVVTLVNGRTILRGPIADVAYIHIELDSPDLLVAEGVATESFVDCQNRSMFDNAAEYAQLYPDALPHSMSFPAPRLEQGWRLQSIRDRLSATRPTKAGELRGNIDILTPDRLEGWVLDDANPETSVEIEIIVAERQIDCVVANQYRVDLDRAGIGHACHGFACQFPSLGASELATLRLVRLADGAALQP